jgi:hypothetical protein
MPGIDQQLRTVRLCQGSSRSSQSNFPLDQIPGRIPPHNDLDRSFVFSLILISRSLLESMPSKTDVIIVVPFKLSNNGWALTTTWLLGASLSSSPLP